MSIACHFQGVELKIEDEKLITKISEIQGPVHFSEKK